LGFIDDMLLSEDHLTTRTGFLQEARKRLEKSSYPPEEGTKLLELLNLLTALVDEQPFQDDQFTARLIQAVADNGKLIMLIERQAAELDALKRITFNLTSSLELQSVLDGVVKEAMGLVEDALDAHIFLYQDEKLVFGASLSKDGEKNKLNTISPLDGLPYQVAHQKKTIVLENATEHPLIPNGKGAWHGSVIGIPLKMGTIVIGVMILARTIPGEFNPSELRLLTLLADQAKLSIINARLHAAASQQARSDALTNLPNRRALDERLEQEVSVASHSGHPLCVIMMDLDGFKIVNDNYGHDVGDESLRHVATFLAQSVRSTDFLARYGGDEMTLILPDTDLPQAAFVARKLQKQLLTMDHPLPDGKTLSLGMTGGIALYPRHADSPPGLLRAADEALYRAKKYARGTFMAAREPTMDLTLPKNINPDKT
jgi:two-component system cell cycle response regulator